MKKSVQNIFLNFVFPYAFFFLFQRLSSAAISKDAGLICGGFEDSSILLWSLTPKKLVRSKSKPEISKVQLAPGMNGCL